jgi:myo-inositol-1(or 4)-monophosphatase
MKLNERRRALNTAVSAAKAVGRLMHQHQHTIKRVHSEIHHDIKLALDLQSQRLIERQLRRAFPAIAILGEEGIVGDPASPLRWVVDPIDGTVNFAYGIPHACVSIALQVRNAECGMRKVRMSKLWRGHPDADYETIVGVVYDPFTDELWTAEQGGAARLNGRPFRTSRRASLREAIVSMGFAKSTTTLAAGLPAFNRLIGRVRKIRMMGAAALGMTFTAAGRFDAYLEYGIRLWDIAAGGLILERAGGEFWHEPVPGEPHTFNLKANNGHLRRKLDRAAGG